MRYWVYINDKVEGPFEEEKLADVKGLSPDTLICSEEVEEGGSQEWVKASSLFEFDEATKTMTRAPLSGQEINVMTKAEDVVVENTPDAAAQGGIPNSAVQILIDKIDNLTHEIEGLKGKLDDALTASAAAQAAAQLAAVQQQAALNALKEKEAEEAAKAQEKTEEKAEEKPAEQADKPADITNEDALITNTQSLVNHAEQVVAQASENTEEKPVDFLDEMDISSDKGGEELVLRSALDSLYGVKIEQTEEEKEATFQDLLSPLKTAAVAATAAGAAAVVVSSLNDDKEEQTPSQDQQDTAQKETPAQEPEAEEKAAEETPEVKEEPVAEEPAVEPVAEETPAQEEAPVQEPVAEEPAVEPAAEEAPAQEEAPVQEPVAEEPFSLDLPGEQLTEEQREELINELTSPGQQNDFIAQALAEAEAQNQQSEEKPQDFLQEIAPQVDVLPVAEEPAQEPQNAEKESLDLGDTPQLSIIGEEEKPAEPVQTFEEVAPAQDNASVADMQLTPMGPAEEQEAVKEVTETIKELVPGKKLEDTLAGGDGIISQADLDEAFSEKAPTEQFPLNAESFSVAPEGVKLSDETDQPTPDLEEDPLPEESYNPGEMTEIELKEGATYLISDFVPPAEAARKVVERQVKKSDSVEELGPGAAAALAATAAATGAAVMASALPETHTKAEEVQEVSSAKEDADLTMSKVILENTIKTKRGATMDIKTVPMVKEPANTDRLDLSDSDLADINAQHDMKVADIKPSNSNTTKIVMGGLVAVVILAVIYVMLAFLGLLPDGLNVLKKGPSAEELQAQEEQLTEMIGPDLSQAPAVAPQNPYAANQPMQMPAAVENQVMAQQPMAQPQQNPMAVVLGEAKNYLLSNGQTLQQVINARHPNAVRMIEWSITTAVEPNNYSILVKVPPENAQSFKISYRFNYNTITKTLDPTISDSKNLLDSVSGR
ncbi:MAG: hypothetical protein IKC13_03285 [Elusimicrobiaceae bacterium]|nr:hypothetical protein [Elusimicrobiaceae bacterium]